MASSPHNFQLSHPMFLVLKIPKHMMKQLQLNLVLAYPGLLWVLEAAEWTHRRTRHTWKCCQLQRTASVMTRTPGRKESKGREMEGG